MESVIFATEMILQENISEKINKKNKKFCMILKKLPALKIKMHISRNSKGEDIFNKVWVECHNGFK